MRLDGLKIVSLLAVVAGVGNIFSLEAAAMSPLSERMRMMRENAYQGTWAEVNGNECRTLSFVTNGYMCAGSEGFFPWQSNGKGAIRCQIGDDEIILFYDPDSNTMNTDLRSCDDGSGFLGEFSFRDSRPDPDLVRMVADALGAGPKSDEKIVEVKSLDDFPSVQDVLDDKLVWRMAPKDGEAGLPAVEVSRCFVSKTPVKISIVYARYTGKSRVCRSPLHDADESVGRKAQYACSDADVEKIESVLGKHGLPVKRWSYESCRAYRLVRDDVLVMYVAVDKIGVVDEALKEAVGPFVKFPFSAYVSHR